MTTKPKGQLLVEGIDHISGIQGSIGRIVIQIHGIEFSSEWMDEPKAINKFNELSGKERVWNH